MEEWLQPLAELRENWDAYCGSREYHEWHETASGQPEILSKNFDSEILPCVLMILYHSKNTPNNFLKPAFFSCVFSLSSDSSTKELEMIIHAFVSTCLDYCNSLFTWFNKSSSACNMCRIHLQDFWPVERGGLLLLFWKVCSSSLSSIVSTIKCWSCAPFVLSMVSSACTHQSFWNRSAHPEASGPQGQSCWWSLGLVLELEEMVPLRLLRPDSPPTLLTGFWRCLLKNTHVTTHLFNKVF